MWNERHGEAAAKVNGTKSERNSQFRIVPKRDSMLLPDAGYKDGWIRKQGERDDAAVDGEGWKSKAYAHFFH